MRLRSLMRIPTVVGFGLLAAVCALALRAPASAADLQKQTINVDGDKRTYLIHVPPGLETGRNHPAVIVLHGAFGDGRRVEHQSQMAEAADKMKFIAVFPNAKGRQWNDGRETTRSDDNDVAFIKALIDSLVEKDGVDPKRVFAAGISNGGIMTQRLACQTDRFAAVAVVSANMPTDLLPKCNKPAVPIVLFLSTTDPLMPYKGGRIGGGKFSAGGTVISAEDTVDFWAGSNGCTKEHAKRLPVRVDDGTEVVQHDFDACGGNVTFYEIEGGGHSWPGTGQKSPITGISTRNIDGTEAMLDFFRQQGL